MSFVQKDFKFGFEFPSTREPVWAHLVERWYQLDSAAYGFCEFYSKNADLIKEFPPTMIFLGSPDGSSETDRAFTAGGAASPAKFVHTLPNVRASSLCQVMNWFGPILCIQNGENSFIKARDEAKYFLQRAKGQSGGAAWVLGYQENQVLAQILSVRTGE